MRTFIVLLTVCFVIVGCGSSKPATTSPSGSGNWPADQLQQKMSDCVSFITQLYGSQQQAQSYCQCMYNQLTPIPYQQYLQNQTQYVLNLFQQPANGYSSMDAYCAAQAGINANSCNTTCGCFN